MMSSGMPAQHQYGQQTQSQRGASGGSGGGGDVPVEDCRDYLRTGRCKYGASCKYNHPPNVQSGGGMKTPLDPSEPMFPIRPNEPVCQYYMKHGTCKFGQACKFHHPPQAPLQAIVNGSGAVLVNVQKRDGPQLMLNPVGTADPSGSSVMLQFLPQRPDEPDCIYFLKNGRCKYGATCRYHHPINYHQRRVDDARRQQQQQQRIAVQDPYSVGAQKVQYVTQAIPTSTYPHSHVVLSDGPVAFLTLDGSATQAYQQVSVVSGPDGMPYCAPVGSGTVTEQGSSASSIASTTSSSLEQLTVQGDPATARNLIRARRNGSGSSLTMYHTDRTQQRGSITQSTSDGSISSRRRTASHGSSSDHSASLYDVSAPAGLPRNGSVGSWQNERSTATAQGLDQSRRVPSNQYVGPRPDMMSPASVPLKNNPNSASVEMRSSPYRGRPSVLSGQSRRTSRRNPHSGENDEGFTMMTSALVKMLDTPEETSAESYSDDDMRYPPHTSYIPAQVPQHHVDASMFERLSLISPSSEPRQHEPQTYVAREASSWSPTWQGSSSGHHVMGPNAQAMAAMQPQHDSGQDPNSPHSSDIGLYLP